MGQALCLRSMPNTPYPGVFFCASGLTAEDADRVGLAVAPKRCHKLSIEPVKDTIVTSVVSKGTSSLRRDPSEVDCVD